MARSIRGSWYMDGSDYVVVVTGHARDSVEIGVGSTVAEAWANREVTALQSVGRDSGESAALRWAVGVGWISDSVEVEEMPEHLRACHREARNWGVYPSNGAERRIVTREEAEEIVESDDDGYARITRDCAFELTDDEAAESVTEPVGDVRWSGDSYAYVVCVYGADGSEPGDSYARVGEDELGLWWVDDGDCDERVNVTGPYGTELEAREAASELADEEHEGETGEDADDMRTRLLTDAAGEPDA